MRSSPPSGVSPASTTTTDDGSSEAVDGVSDVVQARQSGRIPYTLYLPRENSRAMRSQTERSPGRASRAAQTIVYGTIMIPSEASRPHVPGCERTRQKLAIMASTKIARALRLREARGLAKRILMMNVLD